MLARAEAKIRAKEAEIQRKLEEQKSHTSSWRRGEPTDKKPDVWKPGLSKHKYLYPSNTYGILSPGKVTNLVGRGPKIDVGKL